MSDEYSKRTHESLSSPPSQLYNPARLNSVPAQISLSHSTSTCSMPAHSALQTVIQHISLPK